MAVARQEFDRVGSHLWQYVSCRWLGQLGIMVESIRSQQASQHDFLKNDAQGRAELFSRATAGYEGRLNDEFCGQDQGIDRQW